jgi:hypothetical protein
MDLLVSDPKKCLAAWFPLLGKARTWSDVRIERPVPLTVCRASSAIKDATTRPIDKCTYESVWWFVWTTKGYKHGLEVDLNPTVR